MAAPDNNAEREYGVDPPDMVAANMKIASQLFTATMVTCGLSREQCRDLCMKLCETFNICTFTNVQQCKSLIVKYIVGNSNPQVATKALFKYLEYVARMSKPKPESFRIVKPMLGQDEYEGLAPHKEGEMMQPPASAMRRTHVIYVVHDVLVTLAHWIKNKNAPKEVGNTNLERIVKAFKGHVTKLVEFAACRGVHNADDATQPLLKLVDQWKQLNMWTEKEIEYYMNIIRASKERNLADANTKYEAEKARDAQAGKDGDEIGAEEEEEPAPVQDTPLPFRHGLKEDPNPPWHHLPAANGLYMKNTRGYPLKAAAYPPGGYQLKHGMQMPDEKLTKDVDWLHKEMLHAFDDHTNPDELQDIDPMGHKVWKDPERPTRNHWGFTLDGPAKIQENRKRLRAQARGYADLQPMQQQGQAPSSMDDVNAAVARARELATARAFGERGRGRGGWRGGRGGWRGGRGGY